MAREVEEYVVETRFSYRESREGDVRRVDAPQSVRGGRRTSVNSEFDHGAVDVRRLRGDIADEFFATFRVGDVEERQDEHRVAQARL